METNQIQMLTETFEGHAVADHFPDVKKMVELGSGSQREIELVQPPQRGQLRQPRATPWVFEPIIPSPERAT